MGRGALALPDPLSLPCPRTDTRREPRMDRIAPLMHRIRRAWPAWPALAAMVGLAAIAASTAMPSPALAAPTHRGRPPAATLPPDWPADVPVPPGQIQGSTGSAGQWSVLLLVS